MSLASPLSTVLDSCQESQTQRHRRSTKDATLPLSSASFEAKAECSSMDSILWKKNLPLGLQAMLKALLSPAVSGILVAIILAMVLLLAPCFWLQSASPGHIAKTLRMAMKSEVDVVVEETVGSFGFSRQVLLGERNGTAIYNEYTKKDDLFMKSLKAELKHRTKARNIFIARQDSDFKVEDEVARVAIRFSGAVNTEYIAVAFNGGGFLDRRGKQGGHKNWSMRGFYQRTGLYAEFLDNATAWSRAVQDSCDATMMH